jgi:hypothetical protein
LKINDKRRQVFPPIVNEEEMRNNQNCKEKVISWTNTKAFSRGSKYNGPSCCQALTENLVFLLEIALS